MKKEIKEGYFYDRHTGAIEPDDPQGGGDVSAQRREPGGADAAGGHTAQGPPGRQAG